MPRFDVTVAGELNLDLILYGLPEQLLPERELLADNMMLTLGASSGIFVHNLAALGSRVGFQSRIGDDQLGAMALQRLVEGGVDVSALRQVSGSTQTGLTVILQHDGWRNILTYSGTIAELNWDDLDLGYLADSRHFHLSSFYLQTGLRPRVAELFRKMKASGLTTSMDTNDDPEAKWEADLFDVLPYVDVFMPNAREAQKIAGTDNLEEAIKQLSQRVSLLVVKLGHEGAMAVRGSEKIKEAGLKVNAIDAVGAGDSFDAGFLHEYVHGADLKTCLASGNRAGALSTTRSGGTEAYRDRAHREEFFRTHANQ
jgi:sugar/nucleoside kinase (ribokinase family)